jgi:hypothetical protein
MGRKGSPQLKPQYPEIGSELLMDDGAEPLVEAGFIRPEEDLCLAQATSIFQHGLDKARAESATAPGRHHHQPSQPRPAYAGVWIVILDEIGHRNGLTIRQGHTAQRKIVGRTGLRKSGFHGIGAGTGHISPELGVDQGGDCAP